MNCNYSQALPEGDPEKGRNIDLKMNTLYSVSQQFSVIKAALQGLALSSYVLRHKSDKEITEI